MMRQSRNVFFVFWTVAFCACINKIPAVEDKTAIANKVTKPEKQTDGGAQQPKTNTLAMPMTREQKLAVATQLFLFEGGGLRKNLVAWNSNEDFPSLGIAHFIWMPKAAVASKLRFGESFPGMLRYLVSKDVKLPSFIKDSGPDFQCPWTNPNDIKSVDAEALRTLLDDTRDHQVDYAIQNFNSVSDQILDKSGDKKGLILQRIMSIATSHTAAFPLIDYTNFKGSGLGEAQWGLMQVLHEMTADGPEEFGAAAERVLTARVKATPKDGVFMAGWRNRVKAYSLFRMPGL